MHEFTKDNDDKIVITVDDQNSIDHEDLVITLTTIKLDNPSSNPNNKEKIKFLQLLTQCKLQKKC